MNSECTSRQNLLFIYTVYGSHGTIYIFKNYFVTMFSVFSKINYIQIDPKTNIRRDMWILFGRTNWYICRASLFYIVLYRGFKSFGGPWPPVRIGFVDLLCSWIRGQLGLQHWERKEQRKERKMLHWKIHFAWLPTIQLIGLLYNTKTTVNDHQSLTTLTDLHSH